jgi:uncharacterized protein YdbL (DUF1318 family)
MKKTKIQKSRFQLPAFLRTSLIFSLLAASVIQMGCVTVNVNFPESAVQKATDDYVRDLYRAKEKGKVTTPGQEQGTTSASKVSSSFTFALVSEAYADDFKVQSAKADAIKARLRSRLDDLIAQKRSGAIGETNDGKLVLKDTKLPPLLQKKVKQLIDSDNADRMDLYKEVAHLNGLGSDGLATVEKSFARSFQSLSPSGTWIQSSDGSWTQKP